MARPEATERGKPQPCQWFLVDSLMYTTCACKAYINIVLYLTRGVAYPGPPWVAQHPLVVAIAYCWRVEAGTSVASETNVTN